MLGTTEIPVFHNTANKTVCCDVCTEEQGLEGDEHLDNLVSNSYKTTFRGTYGHDKKLDEKIVMFLSNSFLIL